MLELQPLTKEVIMNWSVIGFRRTKHGWRYTLTCGQANDVTCYHNLADDEHTVRQQAHRAAERLSNPEPVSRYLLSTGA